VPGAVALSVATAALVLGARRLHPLCPGALLAAALGVAVSTSGALVVGPVVGTVTLPQLAASPGAVLASLHAALVALPWQLAPALAAPAAAMALAGFVESASVSRRFARADGAHWSGNAELASEGAAGLLAAIAGGALPVGGSFSRTTLARTLGARSRAAGAVTGVVTCAFLLTPGATAILAPLPRAVLATMVLLAVAPLLRPAHSLTAFHSEDDGGAHAASPSSASFFDGARWTAIVAWATCGATLAAEPRLELGLAFGLAVALAPAAVRAALRAIRAVAAPKVLRAQ
jgi:SulP family sulfate permease